MNAIQTLLTDHIGIWSAAETEKKSGRGRASSNAGSVYGIKKLRELILELAVRGKLVPQDASDEPASELLKRIQADKAKLIAEGKIKNDIPLAAITDEEKPFALPPRWQWVKFGEIFTLEYGDNLPAERRTNSGEYPVYGSNGVVGTHDIYFVKSPCIVVGRKGSAGALNLCLAQGCCVTDVAYFCLAPKHIDLFFAFKLFHTLGLDSLGKGIKPGLSRNEAYVLPIAIPPLAEQHRIVAKVNALMALCDQLETQHSNAVNAHEQLVNHLLGTLAQSQSAEDFSANWQRIAAHFDTLFTTEVSIDALKQTLLQLAVMGKLVPQDPNDEPASELLKRIQAEKAKLVAEGQIKKDKPLTAITDDEKTFVLPQGWAWIRFNVVANTRLGKMLDQAKNKGIYRPYLRNTNVQWFDFELDDLKEMRFEAHELDEYRLINNDLVICEGGEPGRCAIWNNQIDEIFIQKALHRARPWPGISPYFLQLCFRVDTSNGHLEQFFTGATIKHFSGEKLAHYPVPLPPASEQHRIAAKVDALMTLCDQLKSRTTAANRLQQKLADVLVEQAVG